MGAVFGIFAGTYLWLPKVTGRAVDEYMGRLHFVTMFIGANLIFLPQHFLGLSGIMNNFLDSFIYSFVLLSTNSTMSSKDNNTSFPLGPHIYPLFLSKPIRVYYPKLDRNIIAKDNRNRMIIYQ